MVLLKDKFLCFHRIEQCKKKLEFLDNALSEGELSEEDAIELGEQVKNQIRKKRLEKNK